VIKTSNTLFSIPIGSRLDFDEEAEIRLTVHIPKNINLDISAEETRVKIRNITGDLRVEGGIGKVDFREVDGKVRIIDGSYSIASDDDDFDDLIYILDDDDFDDLIHLNDLYDIHSIHGIHEVHRLPKLPRLPRLPELPALPELPELPALPELHELQHLQYLQTFESSDWLPE
jgi:hypothetical protein